MRVPARRPEPIDIERNVVLIADARHPEGRTGSDLHLALDLLLARPLRHLLLRKLSFAPDADASIWAARRLVEPVFVSPAKMPAEADFDAEMAQAIMEWNPCGAVMWFDRNTYERHNLLLIDRLVRAKVPLWWPKPPKPAIQETTHDADRQGDPAEDHHPENGSD